MEKLHVHVHSDGSRLYVFHCPGCKYDHGFRVGPGKGHRWEWNGSMELPTFTPSLLCNSHEPSQRCHLYMTDGRIQYLSDCFHELAGLTVDIPDYD